MTDRELLELAAKAAGVGIDDWNGNTPVEYFWDGDPQNPERNYRYWNPLNDDGDALRLSVKLEIDITFSRKYVTACCNSHAGVGVTDYSKDRNTAARRAIVRAAAEIGKQI